MTPCCAHGQVLLLSGCDYKLNHGADSLAVPFLADQGNEHPLGIMLDGGAGRTAIRGARSRVRKTGCLPAPAGNTPLRPRFRLLRKCFSTLQHLRRTEPCNLSPVPVKGDRKSTRLNSSHANISYAVFCLKKKNKTIQTIHR